MVTTIVTISKNKNGDITSKNNYRLTAIATLKFPKFAFRLEDYLGTTDNQFDCKPILLICVFLFSKKRSAIVNIEPRCMSAF